MPTGVFDIPVGDVIRMCTDPIYPSAAGFFAGTSTGIIFREMFITIAVCSSALVFSSYSSILTTLPTLCAIY